MIGQGERRGAEPTPLAVVGCATRAHLAGYKRLMIEPACHVLLRPIPWSESDAGAAIDGTVADALALFDAETFSPAHPLDDNLRNGNTSCYVAAFKRSVAKMTRTVGALLVRSDGRMLLGLRSPWKKKWPSHWDAIGGHVQSAESLETALVREIQEELGVMPIEFSRIGSVRERRPELYGRALHYIFVVKSWTGGEPTNVSDEHTEIRWFTLDETLALSNVVDCDYPRFARLALGSVNTNNRD